ncbi:MAG: pentapeptide repeat-containing protein [Methylobacteriaceae bacterium]|nr:pentapeptide repeat-containing protein [Methylobacteriaceae bacterium]
MKLNKVVDRLEVQASDLSGSEFRDVNISGASFDDANMSGWIVTNANLAGLRVTNANLAGVRLSACRNVGTMTIDGISVADLLAAYERGRESGS